MTYRFVVDPVTQFATLLGDTFGKETISKITLDFIVYFDKQYNMEVSHTILKGENNR